MTYPNVSMETRSQVGNKVQGLCLPGFIGGTRTMWLIDTGAARSISSFKIYNSLPASAKFSLSSANSAIALADGQQAKAHGLGHVVVHLGTKEFHMHVIVAEVEDEGILGMDFLSQVDSHNLNPKASPLGVQLLEPCLTSHSQQKGLHVARTLVDVKEDREVPLRVFNVSNQAYHLAAETVVALAKPVTDVTLLELYEENNESVMGQARVVTQHLSH